jgi:hypothetical protein
MDDLGKRDKKRLKPRPAKWLLFRFFLSFLFGLLLWEIFQPSYSKLLVSASQWFLSQAKQGEETSLRLEGDIIFFIPLGPVSEGKKEADFMVKGRYIRSIQYNSMIFLTLILFTPGVRPIKRALELLIGLLLLSMAQVFSILIGVKSFYASEFDQYSIVNYGSWEKYIYGFLNQFFTLGKFAFPFAIWMLFTYREIVWHLTGTMPEGKQRKRRKKD